MASASPQVETVSAILRELLIMASEPTVPGNRRAMQFVFAWYTCCAVVHNCSSSRELVSS